MRMPNGKFKWTEEQAEQIQLGMTIVVHWELCGERTQPLEARREKIVDVAFYRRSGKGPLSTKIEIEPGLTFVTHLNICDPATLEPEMVCDV